MTPQASPPRHRGYCAAKSQSGPLMHAPSSPIRKRFVGLAPRFFFAHATRGHFQVECLLGQVNRASHPARSRRRVLYAWLRNDHFVFLPPNALFSQIALGSDFSCGLYLDGSLQCFANSSNPLPSRRVDGPFVQISASSMGGHLLALFGNGTHRCYGLDDSGQCSQFPQPSQEPYRYVAAGPFVSCGIPVRGDGACGGSSYAYQTPWPNSFPPFLLSQLAMGVGWTAGVAIKTTVLSGWGTGLGLPSDLITAGHIFSQVTAGPRFLCGVEPSDGSVLCVWPVPPAGFIRPPTQPRVTQFAIGDGHVCGLCNGTAWCWGSNTAGQSSLPASVYTEIVAGASHTCGIRANDSMVACVGANSYGQSSPPQGVPFSKLWAGDISTCGRLFSDGINGVFGRENAAIERW